MNDPISRQAAIKEVEGLPDCPNGFSDTYDKACFIGILEELPTLEPKRGRWKKISDRNYKCSCCNSWWSVDRDSTMNDFKYCPNCGARMDGRQPIN